MLEAFDELSIGGVEGLTHEGPFVIGFEEESQSAGFRKEIDGVTRYGQKVEMSRLENPQELAPMLNEQIQVAYRLEGQRFIEPGPYVQSLADAVVKRG